MDVESSEEEDLDQELHDERIMLMMEDKEESLAIFGMQIKQGFMALSKVQKSDHRCQPRSSRRNFKSMEALNCIRSDYIGILGDPSTPLLGSEFKLMFRISRPRFQVMMEDIMAKNIKFYRKNYLKNQASLKAKLLLPIKSLAYGVPSHTFIDYFQMSPQSARDCCRNFWQAIELVYKEEYTRLPTTGDLIFQSKMLHHLTQYSCKR